MPVSNYEPGFLEILRDGGMKEVRLPMADIKEAIRIRQKLYRLRKDMVKENHAFAKLAIKTEFSAIFRLVASGREISFFSYETTPVPTEEYQTILIIRPTAVKDREILERAGYAAVDPPPLE